MGLNPVTVVLIRKPWGDTDAQRESLVMAEAETGVMCPQAKDCQQPLENRRGQERPFPGAFGGGTALLSP